MDGLHHYDSRDWYDRNWPHVQSLGEDLEAPHAWFKGDRPAVPPQERLVGSIDCLRTGDAIDEALTTENIRDGFNVTCFVPAIPLDPLWETAATFNSCGLQFFYATVLQWAYQAQAAKIQLAFELLLGPSVTTTFHPVAGEFPEVVTVIHPNFSVCVIAGTSNFQQLALQGFYGLTGPQFFTAFRTNAQHYFASTWAHDWLVADGANASAPVFLVGHSYGAAAAHILAARYRHAQPERIIRTLTYGDPKPGDVRMHALLALCPGIALQNQADFVTTLPPIRELAIPVALTLGLPTLLLMDQWEHAPNRTMMDVNGVLYPNQSPALSYTTLLSYVERALLSLPISVILDHAVPVYRERILRRCPDREWPINVPLWNLLQDLDLGSYWSQDYFGQDFFGDDYFP